MITEADALETAQLDGKALYERLEAGAMPEDVARLVVRRILFHISRFDDQRALERAKKAASRRLTAPTFSEQLTARCVTVTATAIQALPPEDGRAIGLWLIGSPPQIDGFLGHAIQGLGESSGEDAVERAATYIQGILDRMRTTDEDLFQTQVKTLTGPRQRIIRGLLLDAQWAFQERDGQTARMRVMSARKIARKWLAERRRQHA